MPQTKSKKRGCSTDQLFAKKYRDEMMHKPKRGTQAVCADVHSSPKPAPSACPEDRQVDGSEHMAKFMLAAAPWSEIGGALGLFPHFGRLKPLI